MEDILVDGDSITGNENMREAARKHFQLLYKEEFHNRPKLDNLCFNKIGEADRVLLESEFTEHGIFACLKDCNGDKAPGLDGFNMKFFQSFWQEVKKDVLGFFNDFHKHGSFVKSINSTFIVLIPKNEGVRCFNDFRPISLIGSIYQLLAKVQVKRFSKLLKSIICDCQHAFLEGRQITDAIMITNEVVGDLPRNKKKGILCN